MVIQVDRDMASMLAVVAGIFGLIFGSAINAYVWRLHAGRSWTKGRSECSLCGHALAARDLVPVLSWVTLRGECRYCHKPIQDPPAVELVTAVVFAGSAYVLAPGNAAGYIQAGFWAVILVLLVVLAVYDVRWMMLPNVVMHPLIVVAGLATALGAVLNTGAAVWQALALASLGLWFVVFERLDERYNWPDMVTWAQAAFLVLAGTSLYHYADRSIGGPALAAASAYGAFYLIDLVTRGKGMGGGDVRLAFAMGLLLGLKSTAVAMLIAFDVAAVVGLILILSRLRGRKDLIPFGPYLVGGTIVAYLFSKTIVLWYLHANGVS
jgi:leader peptidase (prepilin peptidase)/N-methyltransferase